MNKYTLILLFALFSFKSATAQNLYTSWDEASILKYWKKNGLKQYEGIYYYDMGYEFRDVDVNAHTWDRKTYFALKYNESTSQYELIYLRGHLKYTVGEIHAYFKNGYNGSFTTDLVENRTNGNIIKDKYYAKIDENQIKISAFYMGKYLVTYFKDKTPLNFPGNGEVKSSGTGFAITSNGYIATNYHVVEDANSISIKGIRGNFDKSYNAEIVLEDVKNDIAILKIKDTNFISLGKIPYIITSSQLEVGNNVSALGYPLRATMGDEVKYTNGVISSKSGYQGDLTMYQTSVPVQPGNSGGPLISPKGNIIGIMSAKHEQAENVSYALKTAYLLNLIENLSPKPLLNSTNTISKLSTPDKIKTIKNFVYIIEVR
jgi:hypothetical protein